MKGQRVLASLILGFLFLGCDLFGPKNPDPGEAQVSFKNEMEKIINVRLKRNSDSKEELLKAAIPRGETSEVLTVEAGDYLVYWKEATEGVDKWKSITTRTYKRDQSYTEAIGYEITVHYPKASQSPRVLVNPGSLAGAGD